MPFQSNRKNTSRMGKRKRVLNAFFQQITVIFLKFSLHMKKLPHNKKLSMGLFWDFIKNLLKIKGLS